MLVNKTSNYHQDNIVKLIQEYLSLQNIKISEARLADAKMLEKLDYTVDFYLGLFLTGSIESAQNFKLFLQDLNFFFKSKGIKKLKLTTEENGIVSLKIDSKYKIRATNIKSIIIIKYF